MRRKQEVINALESLGGRVRFQELFNFINDNRYYRKGMSYQELRGKCVSMPEIEYKGGELRLVE